MIGNVNAVTEFRVENNGRSITSSVCDYTRMAKEIGAGDEGTVFYAGCIFDNLWHPETYVIYNGDAVKVSNLWTRKYNDWKRENGAKFEKMTLAQLRNVRSTNEFQAEHIRRLIYLRTI